VSPAEAKEFKPNLERVYPTWCPGALAPRWNSVRVSRNSSFNDPWKAATHSLHSYSHLCFLLQMFTALRLPTLTVLARPASFLCFLQTWQDSWLEHTKLFGRRSGAPRVLPTYLPLQHGWIESWSYHTSEDALLYFWPTHVCFIRFAACRFRPAHLDLLSSSSDEESSVTNLPRQRCTNRGRPWLLPSSCSVAPDHWVQGFRYQPADCSLCWRLRSVTPIPW